MRVARNQGLPRDIFNFKEKHMKAKKLTAEEMKTLYAGGGSGDADLYGRD